MEATNSSHLSSSRLSPVTESPRRFNKIVAWFKFRFSRRHHIRTHAVNSRPSGAKCFMKLRRRSVRPVPVFPLEIMELIIYEVWNLQLSTRARRAFRQVSMRVSHTWMATFMRISLADLRITDYAYFDYVWRHILEDNKSIGCKHFDLQSYLENCCRSMTLYINIDYASYRRQCLLPPHLNCPGPQADPNRMASILHYHGLFLRFCHNLLALRHVHLRYHNRLPLDYYDHIYRFHSFPTTVTDLEITHTFDGFHEFPDQLYDNLSDRYIRPHKRETFFGERFPWQLPHIRRLTVRGGHVPLVLTIASRAKGLEEITTDVDSGQVIQGLQRLNISNLRVTGCSPLSRGRVSQNCTRKLKSTR
ncbi:hypothetical protein ARMSODRAFT_1086471 [Armillaria solidipes]|uniref:Uncharacterized protein n=1 Tax=Armillaria solidipes TaxID=1076256 RepID=A0A2H3B890_9AGAR|nr:hypothetical protein ARMSODRAFT_1086471 [Armillaria solidipes]